MAYQKTAKDKAWDRERSKLQSATHQWVDAYRAKDKECQELITKVKLLEQENDALRAAIDELTKGEMTSEEVLQKMRKQAELSDMMKFLVNGTRGMF